MERALIPFSNNMNFDCLCKERAPACRLLCDAATIYIPSMVQKSTFANGGAEHSLRAALTLAMSRIFD